MRFSVLFTKTQKGSLSDDLSRNAQLLTQAGFVKKLMAGVYSYLPLGLRVLTNVENIIREEMEKIGAQEILMPALQPKDIWEQTGRWETIDVLFKLKGAGDRDLALGPTHEEVVAPLVSSYIQSYRDLPQTAENSRSVAVFQIQTKFRNEARAKSGLLRGREFRMKDMYSFHSSQEDLDVFYDRAALTYKKIFQRCGLGSRTVMTFASGGAFSKFSHEFQAVTPYGEDTIYKISDEIALNKEVIDDADVQNDIMNGKKIEEFEEVRAIEVGNIFKLGTKFTDSFNTSFAAKDGSIKPIYMGCYGIGPSRIVGTIAECLSDEKGLVWPAAVAPFHVHLISLARNSDEISQVDSLYEQLCDEGVDTLYDDRHELQAGSKLADADMMGIPIRIIVSSKTLKNNSAELKKRSEEAISLVPLSDVIVRSKELLDIAA